MSTTGIHPAVQRILDLEDALRENLLLTSEVIPLERDLLDYLDGAVTGMSLPALRYRKERKTRNAWVAVRPGGYPPSSPWPRFEPYLAMLSQLKVERTIKRRLSTDDLFIESRARDEDLHVLIGKRDGTPGKAHVIVDGNTGEIRVEDNQSEPTDLVRRIETILHLEDGRKILSTREAIRYLGDE